MPTVNSFIAAALGNSLAVQWLRLQAFIAGDVGSVPDREPRSCMPCNAAKNNNDNDSLRNHWDNIKCTNIYIRRVSEGEE